MKGDYERPHLRTDYGSLSGPVFLYMLHDQLNKNRDEALNDLHKAAGVLPDVAERIRFSFQEPPKRKMSEYLKSALGWVYACVGAIADDVAMINFRLFRPEEDNVAELHEHPILDILHKANSFYTKFDFIWLVQNYLELTGEAPVFVAKEENSKKPAGLFLLRPDRLKLKPSQDKAQLVGGYEYRGEGGQTMNIAPDELVFLKYPDPNNQFRGKGTLEAAARTVDIEDYSEEFNRKFFHNSARPDSVFTTDNKLTKAQRESLKTQIDQQFKGVSNAHKTIILEAGMEWKPMQMSQKDMDFLEQQKFSRDKILGIFRVPRTVLGITDDVNRANAEATDYVFARRTIKPKMQRLIEQLNEFLVPMFDKSEGLFLDYDDPVPQDAEKEARVHQTQITAGVKTINEIRAINGDEPVDGGDVPYVPLNLVPLGAEPDDAATPQKIYKRGANEYGGRRRMRKARPIGERLEKEIFKKVYPEAMKILAKNKPKKKTKPTGSVKESDSGSSK